MSAIQETLGALRDIVRLSAQVERSGALLSEIARELREHDKRLVRLETLIEITQTQGGKDRLPNP